MKNIRLVVNNELQKKDKEKWIKIYRLLLNNLPFLKT